MNSGQIDLTTLGQQLSAATEQTAYVRALLRRREDGWELRHAVIVVGIEPPGSIDDTWEYAEAAFVARSMTTADVIKLALEALAGRATLGELEFAVPTPSPNTYWRHEPSSARYDKLALDRPTMNYTFSRATSDTVTWSPSMLVGRSCPSFTELSTAWRAFTEGDYSLMGAQSPNDFVHLRVADTRGWIERVRVTPTEISVDLAGDALDGCELELYSVSMREYQLLDSAGTTSFPLTSGMPEQAWLWLKSGHSWLDYRVIDPTSPWASPSANVEIVKPVDPQASIEALLASGEGQYLEFKSELVSGRKLKTVAAFASGDGGQIVFGIDRDEVTVVGISGEPAKERDRLEQLVRAAITPTPDTTVTIHAIGDKSILILDVPRGHHELYGVITKSDARDKPEYYIRRGASTYPAQPDEIAHLVQRRIAENGDQQVSPYPWQ